MPGGDRTGPTGMGPMTGRGAGLCAGYSVPGYLNPGVGFYGHRFFGRGFRGGGHGRRNMYYATGLPFWARYPEQSVYPGEFNPENEMTFLKDQAKYFQSALDQINKRINELEDKLESK
ncbi:DUF5320 domain-containing protein [candidate division KSB1 bacterium]|nr:DUF5320 domain-containing protein [candidate division KSB1 bacterium]